MRPLLFLLTIVFGPPHDFGVIVWPAEPVQGQLVVVEILGAEPDDRVNGFFCGRPLRFFVDSLDRVRALSAVSLNQRPGPVSLQVTLTHPGASPVVRGLLVSVGAGSFPKQVLQVDPRFVRPPSDELLRIGRERRAFGRIGRAEATPRQWADSFVWPREARVGSTFGLKRVFNGQLNSRHFGLDISGEMGEPVRAIGAGRVVLVCDCYYSGGTVVIDHGLRLLSMYFHLSEVAVKEGERIGRGQLLGAVGSSGRSTGPHLHLTTKIEGLPFDPTGLLDFDFSEALPKDGGIP